MTKVFCKDAAAKRRAFKIFVIKNAGSQRLCALQPGAIILRRMKIFHACQDNAQNQLFRRGAQNIEIKQETVFAFFREREGATLAPVSQRCARPTGRRQGEPPPSCSKTSRAARRRGRM